LLLEVDDDINKHSSKSKYFVCEHFLKKGNFIKYSNNGGHVLKNGLKNKTIKAINEIA